MRPLILIVLTQGWEKNAKLFSFSILRLQMSPKMYYVRFQESVVCHLKIWKKFTIFNKIVIISDLWHFRRMDLYRSLKNRDALWLFRHLERNKSFI